MKIVPVTVNGRPRFKLDWSDGAKRIRRFYRTRHDAEVVKAALTTSHRDMRAAWARITPAELADTIKAFYLAKQQGCSILDLAQNREAPRASVTCRVALDAFLESKGDSGRRLNYLIPLKKSLNAFIRGQEERSLSQMTTEEIEAYLSRFDSLSTKRTYLGSISNWLNFAVRRGWIAANPCLPIDKPREDRKPPAILTPRQSAKLMVRVLKSYPDYLAWASLALFSGVRPTEISRIHWKDIDPTRKLLTVDEAASKVRQRRLVTLGHACLQWLLIAREIKSKLPVTAATQTKFRRKLAKQIHCALPKGILRHTAASMMLADLQDAPKVSFQLGNSPGILLTHYRELVTLADSQRFFKLIPNRTRPWVQKYLENRAKPKSSR